jgi:tripeptide aminopeptidase
MNVISPLIERFKEYVRLDTQSDPLSTTFPSSKNQLKFGELILSELNEIGVHEVKQDKFGHVLATIPSNCHKKVPTILFCSHLDTSPDCRGNEINPIIHQNYRGNDIILPADTSQVISPKYFPDLLDKIGMDIITSDGNTLLGADNKAGVAELVEVAKCLTTNPEIKHGKILLLFVPDEEIGKDLVNLNVGELGADYAYTLDGHSLGSINNETFCIGTAKLEIHGNPAHTGEGKGLMENAVRIASQVIQNIPASIFPELTRHRTGFVNLAAIEGTMAFAKITFQLRAFEEDELKKMAQTLEEITESVLENFSKSTFKFSLEVTEKNIIEVLKNYPFMIDHAAEAMRRASIIPKIEPLRGATTGTGLSFKGLPTANLFTGQHANHSKIEWICVQDMNKAVETILNLCEVWWEKS